MRRPTPGFLVSLFALVGALLPFAPVLPVSAVASVAAATAPRVAIIVGPAGANTSGYKSDADAIAAVARQYTPNVVQVYTPNATWAAAKAALEGASIVVYMGHGNGFPSPYTSTLQPSTENGLGLNPIAGVNDSTTQYYGESVIASQIHLAPNAFVLLDHLCYASGNSEPGRADPTLAVAQERADNFAAGFLAAGARAVVANAYYGGSSYIDALFTTDLTVDQIWQGGPGANPNVITYASTRTPGMMAELNPDASTGKYWRSLVGQFDLRASQVTGAAGGGTGSVGTTPAWPSSFTVPGIATVAPTGAALFSNPALAPDPTTGQPLVYLPAGTTLRLDSVAGAAPDGSQVFAASLADDSLSGFVAGSGLTGTAAPPRLLSVNDGGGSFSPNGDGRSDVFTVSAQLSAPATWQVTISSPTGSQVAAAAGSGPTVAASWDGTSGGVRVPDGRYSWAIRAFDGSGTIVVARSGRITVDTVPPTLTVVSPSSAATTFAPNGDGVADSVRIADTMSEAGAIDLVVRSASGAVVRTTSVTTRAGAGAFSWDGRSDVGTYVPDGQYTLTATPRDAAGNVGASFSRTVVAYGALSSVRSSIAAFYPQASDGMPASTTFSFALASPASVTWTVTDAAGHRILTHVAAQPLSAGVYSFVWDGRDQTGAIVPAGMYYSVVRASSGGMSFAIRTPVVADAFAIRLSDSTPSRGQTIVVTAIAARQLGAPPTVTIAQPGLAPRTVSMGAITGGYRVRVTLTAATLPGTLGLVVTGVDLTGLVMSSTVAYPLG